MTISGSNTVHTFTSNGTFTISNASAGCFVPRVKHRIIGGE